MCLCGSHVGSQVCRLLPLLCVAFIVSRRSDLMCIRVSDQTDRRRGERKSVGAVWTMTTCRDHHEAEGGLMFMRLCVRVMCKEKGDR